MSTNTQDSLFTQTVTTKEKKTKGRSSGIFFVQPPTGKPHLAKFEPVPEDPEWGIMLTLCGDQYIFPKRHYLQLFSISQRIDTPGFIPGLCQECYAEQD